MGNHKKQMVHETIPCRHIEEELRIGRWKLDSSKQNTGIIYIAEDDTKSHYHFYWNTKTKRFEAHIKDHTTLKKRPFEMSFQEFRAHQIEKAMLEAGARIGEPPYGFVRQIQGRRYPKKLNYNPAPF